MIPYPLRHAEKPACPAVAHKLLPTAILVVAGSPAAAVVAPGTAVDILGTAVEIPGADAGAGAVLTTRMLRIIAPGRRLRAIRHLPLLPTRLMHPRPPVLQRRAARQRT